MSVNSELDRYLILSDLHFGVDEVSLNDSKVVDVLCKYIADNKPWKAVIFSGDLLDINLSIVTIAIEGKNAAGKHILGFREFMGRVINELQSESSVDKWIYIPGNHDYWIWNTLSTQVACLDILSCGECMKLELTPLMEYEWEGGSAFISGIFPHSIHDRVIVKYPDHIVKHNEGDIIITHGHYLDQWQIEFKDLCQSIRECKDHREAVRSIFKRTAQYQAIANAVSYTSRTRRFVNLLFGPGSIKEKTIKFFKSLFKKNYTWMNSYFRNKPIDIKQLVFIEYYLKYFRKFEDHPPKYFIFGHTHKQGSSSTTLIPDESNIYQAKEIKVFNAGSFFADQGSLATFITIDIIPGEKPQISLHKISEDYRMLSMG